MTKTTEDTRLFMAARSKLLLKSYRRISWYQVTEGKMVKQHKKKKKSDEHWEKNNCIYRKMQTKSIAAIQNLL